jgi:hypothetical protein
LDGIKRGFKESPEKFELPISTMLIVATTIMVVNRKCQPISGAYIHCAGNFDQGS